jgi:hypothetical protein
MAMLDTSWSPTFSGETPGFPMSLQGPNYWDGPGCDGKKAKRHMRELERAKAEERKRLEKAVKEEHRKEEAHFKKKK